MYNTFNWNINEIFLKTSCNANITNQTVDEVRNLIMHLGNLYASTFDMDTSLDVKIHDLLMTYYEGSYDITEIMKDVCMQLN